MPWPARRVEGVVVRRAGSNVVDADGRGLRGAHVVGHGLAAARAVHVGAAARRVSLDEGLA